AVSVSFGRMIRICTRSRTPSRSVSAVVSMRTVWLTASAREKTGRVSPPRTVIPGERWAGGSAAEAGRDAGAVRTSAAAVRVAAPRRTVIPGGRWGGGSGAEGGRAGGAVGTRRGGVRVAAPAPARGRRRGTGAPGGGVSLAEG